MSLFNSLMRYKNEARVTSFDMHGDKKATATLPCGKSILVYMSDQYIVGESEVAEAAEPPAAGFLLYNNWDTVGQGASKEAKRLGIEIHTFGAFGHKLDELNGGC